MTVTLGLLLAVGSAVLANLAGLLKHRGCGQAPPVDLRRPVRTAIRLWSRRSFAVGMAVGGVAWGLHVAAISMAPLSLVQVVLAGGVVLIAGMADRLFGVEVGWRQRWGLALTAAGLILLVVSMPAVDGASRHFSLLPMIVFELGLFGVGMLLLLGSRGRLPDRHHGIALAVSAGVLFGVCNVAVKAITGLVALDGMAGLLTPWLALAVAGSFMAFFASARSLQVGGPVEVIAVTGTAANITVIAGGILIFKDPVAGDALGLVAQASAILMVVAAAALMPAARSASPAPAPAAAGA
jgi:hypothetical protein